METPVRTSRSSTQQLPLKNEHQGRMNEQAFSRRRHEDKQLSLPHMKSTKAWGKYGFTPRTFASPVSGTEQVLRQTAQGMGGFADENRLRLDHAHLK